MHVPGNICPGVGLGIVGGVGIFPGAQSFVTRIKLTPSNLNVQIFNGTGRGLELELKLSIFSMTFFLKGVIARPDAARGSRCMSIRYGRNFNAGDFRVFVVAEIKIQIKLPVFNANLHLMQICGGPVGF